MEIFLFILGGLINFVVVSLKIPDDVDESQIVKTGWSAFIMGALVWGGLMNLIYLMF